MKSFVLTEKNTKGIHLDLQQNAKLGRIASQIALWLRGKHKATYTPNMLCGDKVVVTNVKNIECTTKYKVYYKHTNFPGGLKELSYEDAKRKDPLFPLMMAVKRMLNKSKLRKLMLRNLYLFEGNEHTLSGYPLTKISL